MLFRSFLERTSASRVAVSARAAATSAGFRARSRGNPLRGRVPTVSGNSRIGLFGRGRGNNLQPVSPAEDTTTGNSDHQKSSDSESSTLNSTQSLVNTEDQLEF